MKKFSVILLIATLLCVIGPNALAENDCSGYHSEGNPYLCCTSGNCTWWAWSKRPDLPAWSGNASGWLTHAQSAGIPTGSNPLVGSIACFPNMAGGVGHVAYVRYVHGDGSFYVSEMGCGYWSGVIYTKYNSGSAAGFIYGGPVSLIQSQTPANPITDRKNTALNDRNPYGWTASPVSEFGAFTSPGWWFSFLADAQYVYSSDGTAKNCQLALNNNWQSPTAGVVYDAVGGALYAYCVGWEKWSIWNPLDPQCENTPQSREGGPNSCLGMPITNSYRFVANQEVWRKDFQKGYIKNGVIYCYTTCAPGWATGEIWNNRCSYLFADAYDRNGAARDLGEAQNRVHVLSGNILIQDFDDGADGAGMIMYDQQNWACNTEATNEAYWLYGTIKDRYDDPSDGTQGGIRFGCATIDRFYLDGKWCQDFKNGSGTRYRIYASGSPEYSVLGTCPGGTFHVAATLDGPSFTPLVGHFNTDGAEDIALYDAENGRWFVALNESDRFDQVNGPYTYNSWLEDWGTGTGLFKPLVADFTGDGKADICVYRPQYGRWYVARNDGDRFTQVNGPYTENSWFNDWGTGSGLTPLVGYFNSDNLADIALYEHSTGRWFVAFNNYGSSNTFSQANGPYIYSSWFTDWGAGSGLTALTGDFNGDGKTDVGLYEASTGRWFVAFNNYGTQNSFSQANGTYIYSSWYTGFGASTIPLVGDFNNDGKSDIGYYLATYGRWFVAYNDYGTYNRFDQASGTATNGSWLTDWGTGSGLSPLVGNFSSGPHDIGLYDPENGRWFVAFNNYGTAQSFTQSNGPYPYYAWYDDWGKESGGQGKIVSPQNGETSNLPITFSLSQNYPNPFNPATIISYTLPAASQVQLEVYNTLGQKVATLVNEVQQAGEHTAQWDCSACASGVYFYRLRAGKSSEVRKMILLK